MSKGADNCRRNEQGRQEHEAAPQEHRGEEAIFLRTEAVTQHADEPQKGDAGERNEVQRQRHAPGAIGQPGARVQRIGWNHAPEDPKK